MPLDEQDAIPITIVTGYRGAGKSQLVASLRKTLEHRIDTHPRPGVGAAAAAAPQEAQTEFAPPAIVVLVDEGAGDLLHKLGQLARPQTVDAIWLETSPRCHPLELALQITDGDERVEPPQNVIIDAIVTVVDASTLMAQLKMTLTGDRFETDEMVDETDPRATAEVLVDQIECCDIIVINKIDLISSTQLSLIEALLIRLNPRAKILMAENGKLPPDEILDTALYDFEEIEMGAGWLAQLSGEFEGLGDSNGVVSITYRQYRPFHPERLAEILEQPEFDGLIRAKGRIWVATRHQEMGLLSIVGNSAAMAYGGAWFAATPASGWPTDPDARAEILENWVLPFGDRCQQLAFIGVAMDIAGLRRAFDRCLLNDEEMKDGPDSWRLLADPLPDWYEQDGDDPSSAEDPEESTPLS